jgi:hypothetical protein
MPPHGNPLAQVGATKEVAPEKGGEKSRDTVASLGKIGRLSRKTDYRDPDRLTL